MNNLAALIGAQLNSEPRRLAIVFFHVDQDPGHPFEQMRGAFDGNYDPVITASVTAASLHHPEALIVMMTDDRTKFPDIPMKIIRLPVKREWIMYERSRCQQAFAQVWDAKALHLDTDILLRMSFHDFFKSEFNIGVTYRTDHPGMHINGGMLMCNSPPHFITFMDDLITLHNAIAIASLPWSGHDLRCFRGQQMALAILLHASQPGIDMTPWGNIAIFDGKKVNRPWTPQDDGMSCAVHFKGGSKAMLSTMWMKPGGYLHSEGLGSPVMKNWPPIEQSFEQSLQP